MHSALDVRPAQDKHKFFAADPPDDVRLANRLLQKGGHASKHLVAARVPMGIVDLLKVVKVDSDQRDFFRRFVANTLFFYFSPNHLEYLLKLVIELSAIDYSGQMVDTGLLFHLRNFPLVKLFLLFERPGEHLCLRIFFEFSRDAFSWSK